MRVRLNAPIDDGDGVSASSNEDPSSVSESVDQSPLKSLDTRVAWGKTIPRSPGL